MTEKEKLNAMTTRADAIYTMLVEDQKVCEDTDFLKGVEIFMDEMVDYLESIGGKVEGVEYE